MDSTPNPAVETPLDRALNFMEWLCSEPVLDGDDRELDAPAISKHAAIELASIRKQIADTPAVETRLVPVEAVRRLILAADSYGVRYLDSDDMSDEAEELQAATEAMKDTLAAPALPAAEPVDNVVLWHRTTDKKPEPGHKFVALYDDGSGAWLGFAHDGGIIDSDGDDYERMRNAEWWAYLPTGYRLCCEDHPDEQFEVQLPEHVCPPFIHPAPRRRAGDRTAGETGRAVSRYGRDGSRRR